MANQSASERKDQTGGGDVTKSEQVATPETANPTVWEPFAGTHGTESD